MKTLILVLAAVALQTGAACAAEGAAPPPRQAIICRWEAAQQSGIPMRICMTRKQWAARTAYTQQWIREFQARSFVKM
jgi:hypothetical protein